MGYPFSFKAANIFSLCARPVVSTTHLTITWSTRECSQARSWYMSLTLTPKSAMSRASLAMPPGRSDTVAEKRMRRWSAASPRSITRPSTEVSMLPPHSSTHTFLPLYLPNSGPPGRIAASAAAPPPSTTSLSISMSRSMASAIIFSDTVQVSSTKCLATSKDVGPTTGTASPSASVASLKPFTGLPALRAAAYEATFSGSTPMTCTSGLMVFTASDTPAMRPAPPTGTRMTSTLRVCSRISKGCSKQLRRATRIE
mmetsp:Transcript_15116/g.20723  ORF Transcript_15116/g.20723 Transcript_15116/m.20723 type:complete len:256 (-) Transcript_15116:148-915(-)